MTKSDVCTFILIVIGIAYLMLNEWVFKFHAILSFLVLIIIHTLIVIFLLSKVSKHK